MRVVVLDPSVTKFEVRRSWHSEDYGARCVSASMGLVILTFDLLTLKLVCHSHLRSGTFLQNLGTLGLWVLELFAMYATDGQMDRRADKSKAYCPLPYGREHNKIIRGRLRSLQPASYRLRTADVADIRCRRSRL